MYVEPADDSEEGEDSEDEKDSEEEKEKEKGGHKIRYEDVVKANKLLTFEEKAQIFKGMRLPNFRIFMGEHHEAREASEERDDDSDDDENVKHSQFVSLDQLGSNEPLRTTELYPDPLAQGFLGDKHPMKFTDDNQVRVKR